MKRNLLYYYYRAVASILYCLWKPTGIVELEAAWLRYLLRAYHQAFKE
jgi:hypothetical protein